MNTIFLLLLLASLICIPIFMTMGLVNIIRKRSSKKRFKLAGISALVLIISFIGLCFTLDDDSSTNKKEASSINTESSANGYALAESTTAEPLLSPAASLTPTPAPTPTLTPMPTEAPTSQPTVNPQPQPESSAAAQSSEGTGSGAGNSNFNTYDNKEQQQTTNTYVLNTDRMKIHYPDCSSVPKIAPQNYATSNESISDLKARGYSTCGNCFNTKTEQFT